METISLDKENVPLMHVENASSLISDSGITRYKIDAKVWDVYSGANNTNWWYFPEGIYVEKFDTLFQAEASVIADTAYYFSKTSIWRLVKNVKIVNLQQTEFETSELYWDEKKGIVYSDSLVHIKEKDAMDLYGVGFWSRQDMSKYTLYNAKPSTFMISEQQPDSTVQQ